MGNKSTRISVAEKYTRPQGLYDCKDLDYRKLRRLILNGQLAPCFPGADECTYELDKCPICFLFYPSLNRSRCCSNAICTECYLQIKAADSSRFVQCPYCKTPSYTVEFRGAKTAEEKNVEQAEEQKVIEAKIRMRQRELREEAERVKKLAEDTQAEPFGHEGNFMSMESGMFGQAVGMQGSLPGLNRTEQFDLDDDDMMLMEAAGLSIQEQGPMHEEFDLAQRIPDIRAEIAERQAEVRGGDRIANRALENGKNLIANRNEGRGLAIRPYTIDPLCRGARANGRFLQKEKQDVICGNWHTGKLTWWNEQLNDWSDDDLNANSSWSSIQRAVGRDSAFDLVCRSSSEAVEAGTSFSRGVTPSAPELWEAPDDVRLSQSSDDSAGETRLSSASGSRLPLLTFDEQIMVAMVLSLADA